MSLERTQAELLKNIATLETTVKSEHLRFLQMDSEKKYLSERNIALNNYYETMKEENRTLVETLKLLQHPTTSTSSITDATQHHPNKKARRYSSISEDGVEPDIEILGFSY